jgi:hypothetical protein
MSEGTIKIHQQYKQNKIPKSGTTRTPTKTGSDKSGALKMITLPVPVL